MAPLRLLPITLSVLLVACAAATTTNFTISPFCGDWKDPLPEADRPVKKDRAQKTVFFTDGTNFDDIVTLLFLAKTQWLEPIAIYIGANAWAGAGPSLQIMYNILHMFSDRYRDVPIFLGSYAALQDEKDAKDSGYPLTIVPRYRAVVPWGPSGILHSDSAFGSLTFLPVSPNHFTPGLTPDSDDESLAALAKVLEGYADDSLLFLTTGTLTPIAKMFESQNVNMTDKKILPKMARMVSMGGAVNVPGNLFSLPVNTKAEFNIYNDPHATEIAYRELAKRGKKTLLVPLDATNDVPITENLFDEMTERARTVEAQYMGFIINIVRDTWFNPPGFFEEAFLWDPTAAIVAAHHEVVLRRKPTMMRVVIDQGPLGALQGWTKPCDAEEIAKGMCYNVDVVYDVDGKLAERKLVSALQSNVNSAQRGLLCPGRAK